MSTEENDLILDFFLGSGTTAAVAHKMNRKYIGIEQMDYIDDITIPRLHRVIKGDSSGVSREVGWQDGGSFVYCELFEAGNKLIDEIEHATEETIQGIKEKIYSHTKIVPFITKEELEEADSEFQDMNLEDKKKALCLLVDKNKLYVNLSDLEDENYNIKDEDKNFTKSFYEREV